MSKLNWQKSRTDSRIKDSEKKENKDKRRRERLTKMKIFTIKDNIKIRAISEKQAWWCYYNNQIATLEDPIGIVAILNSNN